MNDVSLGDLIRPARVVRAGRADYPVLSMTMRDGLMDQAARFKKRIASTDLSDYKVAARGQLVVGFPIDEGVLDFQELYAAGIVSPAYGIWDLIDTSRVDRNYLKLALRSPRSLSYYRTRLRGSTARRRSLPADVFLALPLRLPPIAEQRRIAAILDHADTLRAKRRQVLTHLNALNQSIFVHMFGDPDMANETVPFGQVSALSGGRNLVADDHTAESEYRVLKISAVTTGLFKPEESKPLPRNYVPPATHMVRSGDLLMSRANTTELVGAVAFVASIPSSLALPDKIWRFDWKVDADPRFWHALLSNPSIRRRISQLSSGTGGSMKNVSKAKLEAMPVPRIPFSRQLEFADRAGYVAQRQADLLRMHLLCEELFLSLQSKAFRGEL